MLNPGDLVGPYIVRRYLGSSSIGAGYEVEHGDAGTVHALNLLPVANTRVPIELSDQLGLYHANLLTVTALLHVSGHMGVLTEHFAGRPLGDLMANSELDLEAILEVFHEILQGVGGAHAAGVLHLDLRPGNVLVGGAADAPIIKVAFFRIARILRETDEHAAIVTTRFAAPELMMPGMEVDPTADVYALGAMLYEMVSGQPAFSGNAPSSLRAKTIGRYTPVQEVAPDVPNEIAEVIDHAMRPRPFDRFQTVEEMGRAMYGTAFSILQPERREVHEGTARPVTRSTGVPPDRHAIPYAEPAEEEDEDESSISKLLVLAAISVFGSIFLIISGIAFVGISTVSPEADLAAQYVGGAVEASAANNELVDDAIRLGADAGRLLPLQRAYQNSPASRKVFNGYRLHVVLADQLAQLPPPSGEDIATDRRRVELEFAESSEPLRNYVNAIAGWADAAGSFTGGFAVALGLASGPPPDALALLSVAP
jgi:serine/threonine protein kinase